MDSPTYRAQILMLLTKMRIANSQILTGLAVYLMGFSVMPAADFTQTRSLYFSGQYEECIQICLQEVAKGLWFDGWAKLQIQAHLELGQYEQAKLVYEQVQQKFGNSLSLRMLAIEAYRFCGQSPIADKLLDEIPEMVRLSAYRFTDRENRLALGRLAIALGEDARQVLKSYDLLVQTDPNFVEAFLAIGELAIDKADYQEAVKALEQAAKLRGDDPQVHFLLAQAWQPSDASRASQHLNQALSLNAKHADSLILQARHWIDGEQFSRAIDSIQLVLDSNPHHPTAHALLAAVAHLTGHFDKEVEHREQALKPWPENPKVDYMISVVLSRHYRFAEAVQYARRALEKDSRWLNAKFQLAQDLLRLGQDEPGWELVHEVAKTDRYNVEAFNLRTLFDSLSQFETIEGDGIWIRMDSKEAKIYGPRVLRLLEQAKLVLEKKYNSPLKDRVVVEIFPRQSDFAIRTFGLPGGLGYLGVCFGSLITANSPASQGELPANWESVLWHEFCHSITLQMTNNRMPRWLSEGISVYEELEKDSRWGQSINPTYQQMLLSDDLVPLSQLSSAFSNPASPLHLQFAYFQSSLAVRFLIDANGFETFQRLLLDLSLGVSTAQALENRYGSVAMLDEKFREYAIQLADEFHPQTNFSRLPESDRMSEQQLRQDLLANPNRYWSQRQLTQLYVAKQDWSQAELAVVRLLELYPDDSQPNGGLELAVAIARGQNRTSDELNYLRRLAELTSDRVAVLNRLIELHRAVEDWGQLIEASEQLLAIQPLISTGHQAMVDGYRQLNRLAEAIEPLSALKLLEPTDPVAAHFHLSQALLAANQLGQSKRELLKALEISPRYREALALLLQIRAREK